MPVAALCPTGETHPHFDIKEKPSVSNRRKTRPPLARALARMAQRTGGSYVNSHQPSNWLDGQADRNRHLGPRRPAHRLPARDRRLGWRDPRHRPVAAPAGLLPPAAVYGSNCSAG